jgi:hypothetical protein
MLDGVFKRNKFVDVWRQRATTFNVRPEHNRRRKDQGALQAYRFEVIVEARPLTAMQCVARASHTEPAGSPVARPPDVRATFIGEKYVSTSGRGPASLRGSCQWRQVGIVRDDDEHIDVLRIRLGRDDGAQDGNALHARQLPGRPYEATQPFEQLWPVTIGGGVHLTRLNPAVGSRSRARQLRPNATDQAFA